MTFEEFFTKKRIDLAALEAGEPALFAEFRTHYLQMGEKSFDHTKKYWFNKLRLQYHLAPQAKPEKMHLENRLAEQIIAKSLTETVPQTAESPATKAVDFPGENSGAKPPGFKPRFKAGALSSSKETKETEVDTTPTPDVNEAAAKLDRQPSFEQEKEETQAKADTTPRPVDNTPTPGRDTKPAGFTPRFKTKIAPGAGPQTKENTSDTDQETTSAEPENTVASTEQAAIKPAGFKPRFNAAKMAPAKAADEPDQNSKTVEPEAKTTDPEVPFQPNATDEQPPAKPAGFKPRFNAARMKPKPPQE